ncbi:MAG: twin transmembrane helix small protein [Rhodospirillales bacterium]
MEEMLPVLLGVAMAATLLVLIIGVVSFGVHGDFYKRHANNLMRVRVLLQGIAVAIFAGMVFLAAG